MGSLISPYTVFRVDRPDPHYNDAELGAYQLPNGEVRVLTNNLGQSEIRFRSREEADRFLGEITGRLNGEVVQLDPADYVKVLTTGVSFEAATVEASASPQQRAAREKPAETPDDSGVVPDEPEPDSIGPGDRASGAGDPADAAGTLSLGNGQRAEDALSNAMPGSLDEAGERAENAVSSFFGNGLRAAAVLRGQIEEDVSDGGNAYLGALAATGLDALSLAMGVTQGNALGLLDTRNLGEGLKQGTWEGIKDDAGRALNILPAGRAANAIDKMLMVSDLIEAAGKGNAGGLAVAAGAVALAALTKGKGKKKKRKRRDPLAKYRSKIKLTPQERKKIQDRVQELHDLLGNDRSKASKTTAIIVVRDRKTKEIKKLISSSMNPVHGRIQEKLRSDEEMVPGINREGSKDKNDHSNHAEVNGIAAAIGNGYEIVEIFPSKNACPLCSQLRAGLGFVITDPLKK